MTFDPEIFPTAIVIKALCPNAVVAVDEDEKGKETIRWIDMKGDSKPTDSQITAKRNELKAAYDSKKYQRDRASEYPSVVDQLDDIYHNGIDAWKATIKTTKDKYPKS
tara:strand:+ start:14362 stop:14685 length:324 start_codon:yes stop_codon:yes gene_type:complete